MKRVKLALVGILAAAAIGIFAVPGPAYAEPIPAGCPGGPPAPPGSNWSCPRGGQVVDGKYQSAASGDLAADGSGGPVCIAVPIRTGSQSSGNCLPGQVEIKNDSTRGGAIIEYLRSILFIMNLLVGSVILLVMVIAGIQYIVSTGDPTRVKNAKGRLQNAIIALVMYLMMYAILNFLIPGGVL